MTKKKQSKISLETLVLECEERFERWKEIHENGCSDPTWPDGVNLNLVRNHIIFAQRKIKEYCGENGEELPVIVFRELPPKLDSEYMANAETIRAKGEELQTKINESDTYREFTSALTLLSPEQRKLSEFQRIILLTKRLNTALEKNKLVDVRGVLRWQDEFFENLPLALSKAKDMPIQEFQLSMFDSA